MTTIAPAIVDTIAALGFDVYAPAKGLTTYLYFTDGKNIGYLQQDRLLGWTMSTVHIPNPQTGTGFGMGTLPNFTRDELRKAFVEAPSWASSPDRQSVTKWPDMAAFVKAERIVPLTQIAKGK